MSSKDCGTAKQCDSRQSRLLNKLILADEDGMSCRILNMKVVVDLVEEAWDEIKAETLRKSWEKSYHLIIKMQFFKCFDQCMLGLRLICWHYLENNVH